MNDMQQLRRIKNKFPFGWIECAISADIRKDFWQTASNDLEPLILFMVEINKFEAAPRLDCDPTSSLSKNAANLTFSSFDNWNQKKSQQAMI